MIDQFDNLMIDRCDILFKSGAAVLDDYGQDSQALAAVVSSWPCRRSTFGRGRERKERTQAGIGLWVFFMRVPNVEVTNHHFIRHQGTVYNIINVDNPSNLSHHLEITVELVTP